MFLRGSGSRTLDDASPDFVGPLRTNVALVVDCTAVTRATLAWVVVPTVHQPSADRAFPLMACLPGVICHDLRIKLR